VFTPNTVNLFTLGRTRCDVNIEPYSVVGRCWKLSLGKVKRYGFARLLKMPEIYRIHPKLRGVGEYWVCISKHVYVVFCIYFPGFSAVRAYCTEWLTTVCSCQLPPTSTSEHGPAAWPKQRARHGVGTLTLTLT